MLVLLFLALSCLGSWQGTMWSVDMAEKQNWNLSTGVGIDSSSKSRYNNHSAISTTNHHNMTTFSACLLIKDDNDILNEWIAYHYHVLNLRTLIVAIDPSSQSSPSSIFNRWRRAPWNMTIIEWTDADYMPLFFLEGHYEQVPGFVPHSANTSVWHRHEHNLTLEQIEADLQQINQHRFRQATFVSRCFRRLKQDQTSPCWTLHVDTDEYVVLNPRLRLRPKAVTGVVVPPVPSAGSVVQFLLDMYKVWPKRLFKSCLTMPSLLFGAVENVTGSTIPSTPLLWRHSQNIQNPSRFETLRWTVHAGFGDPISGLPKTMIDVSTLPYDHPIFVQDRIKTVHQPLDSSYPTTKHKQICRRLGHTSAKEWEEVRLFPLSIQHYVGSKERYFSRKDVRRNVQIYHDKASVHDGVDDGWIKEWWPNFVDTYGIEAVRGVLYDYIQS
jgi:hypothetical protein